MKNKKAIIFPARLFAACFLAAIGAVALSACYLEDVDALRKKAWEEKIRERGDSDWDTGKEPIAGSIQVEAVKLSPNRVNATGGQVNNDHLNEGTINRGLYQFWDKNTTYNYNGTTKTVSEEFGNPHLQDVISDYYWLIIKTPKISVTPYDWRIGAWGPPGWGTQPWAPLGGWDFWSDEDFPVYVVIDLRELNGNIASGGTYKVLDILKEAVGEDEGHPLFKIDDDHECLGDYTAYLTKEDMSADKFKELEGPDGDGEQGYNSLGGDDFATQMLIIKEVLPSY